MHRSTKKVEHYIIILIKIDTEYNKNTGYIKLVIPTISVIPKKIVIYTNSRNTLTELNGIKDK